MAAGIARRHIFGFYDFLQFPYWEESIQLVETSPALKCWVTAQSVKKL
jgi:hypothetical protein